MRIYPAALILPAAAVVLSSPAMAAPTGPSTVDSTVKNLQAQGYNVVVNRTGAAPLAQCTVSSVRPGQTHQTADTRGGSSITTTVISRTVYVDVTC
jgi:hypothetical protein